MTASQAARSFDFYGHTTDYYIATTAGYPPLISAASGSVAGTIVNPGTADPTGTTTNILGTDMYGQMTLTTAGTQTTGALRTINFNNPIPGLRPFQIAIFTSGGVAAGGAITATLTTAGIAISVGTALTTATAYTLAWSFN